MAQTKIVLGRNKIICFAFYAVLKNVCGLVFSHEDIKFIFNVCTAYAALAYNSLEQRGKVYFLLRNHVKVLKHQGLTDLFPQV